MPVAQRNGIVPAIGVVIVLAAVWLSIAHERAAVAWSQGLERHGGEVVSLKAGAAPDSVPDGHMVRLSGVPGVEGRPADPDFDVTADSPVLVRVVEMFQWREVGHGGYMSYEQDWVAHPVDSSRFRQPEGHANTQPFPFEGKTFRARDVRLGGFVLDPAIVAAMPHPARSFKPDFSHLPANLQASFQVSDGMLVSSAQPGHPRLGDLRVRWLAVPLDTVTVVARARQGRLVPAADAADGRGFSVQLGERSLSEVHPDLPQPPGATRWWRVASLLLAGIGVWLVVGRWRSGRAAVMLAVAGAAAVIGIVIGALWVTTNVASAAIAWGVAVLTIVYAIHVWRRPTAG